jgi:hypothetical protein
MAGDGFPSLLLGLVTGLCVWLGAPEWLTGILVITGITIYYLFYICLKIASIMTSILLYTILTLSLLGAILAVVLYFVAQRFKVTEDPRIDQVAAVLPGANCGLRICRLP